DLIIKYCSCNTCGNCYAGFGVCCTISFSPFILSVDVLMNLDLLPRTVPKSSPTSKERMEEATPSAPKSTQTATSSRGKGPVKYIQLLTSST
ncbi:hypothetical protein MJO29_001182, partial [Puccinia striiformis f. sp. tritici]